MSTSKVQKAERGLQTAYRDVRVATGGVRLAQQAALPCRGSAFAQAIIARYGGWQARWPRLDLVLRQNGVTVHSVYHQTQQLASYHRTQVQLAPRLALPVQGETRIVRRPLSGRVEPIRTEQLIERLLTRERRIDTVARAQALTVAGSNQTASSGTGIGVPLARPLPTVVRRSLSVTASGGQPLTAAMTMTIPGPRPAAGGGASQESPLPVNINRLTDQVIQAIDRRIIAQRERLGRI